MTIDHWIERLRKQEPLSDAERVELARNLVGVRVVFREVRSKIRTRLLDMKEAARKSLDMIKQVCEDDVGENAQV